jgi:hypothetical protein
MRTEQLAELIEQPKFHKRLLGVFAKAYSLGVGRDPKKPSEPALIVHVEGDEAPSSIPDEVEVDGEKVRVIAKTGFKAPRPLQSTEFASSK